MLLERKPKRNSLQNKVNKIASLLGFSTSCIHLKELACQLKLFPIVGIQPNNNISFTQPVEYLLQQVNGLQTALIVLRSFGELGMQKLEVISRFSPPGHQGPVKKASRCRNERQEGLAGGKRVEREKGRGVKGKWQVQLRVSIRGFGVHDSNLSISNWRKSQQLLQEVTVRCLQYNIIDTKYFVVSLFTSYTLGLGTRQRSLRSQVPPSEAKKRGSLFLPQAAAQLMAIVPAYTQSKAL